jgi:hypothetical protein
VEGFVGRRLLGANAKQQTDKLEAVMSRRFALCVAILLGISTLFAGPDAPKNRDYTGKVVPLATLLAKQKIKLDSDAAAQWLALQCDDGKIYPLIKDDGGRMFFKDERLLNRPMRLTARLVPETNFLQVTTVHSLVKGELHDLYYWCDICSIRRNEKQICDCCGGPMELKEEPVKK